MEKLMKLQAQLGCWIIEAATSEDSSSQSSIGAIENERIWMP
jgi:hypothetical protein